MPRLYSMGDCSAVIPVDARDDARAIPRLVSGDEHGILVRIQPHHPAEVLVGRESTGAWYVWGDSVGLSLGVSASL